MKYTFDFIAHCTILVTTTVYVRYCLCFPSGTLAAPRACSFCSAGYFRCFARFASGGQGRRVSAAASLLKKAWRKLLAVHFSTIIVREALIKSSAHIAPSDLRTVSADGYVLHTLIYDSLLRTQKYFQL